MSSLGNVIAGKGNRGLGNEFIIFSVRAANFSSLAYRVVRVNTMLMRGNRVASHFSAFMGPGMPVPFHVRRLADVGSDVIVSTPAVRRILPGFLRFDGSTIVITRGTSFSVKFVVGGYSELKVTRSFACMSAINVTHFLLPTLGEFGLSAMTGTIKISLRGRRQTMSSTTYATRVFIGFMGVLRRHSVQSISVLGRRKTISMGAVEGLPACRIVVFTEGRAKHVGLCGLIDRSRLGCCREHPHIPGDILRRCESKLLIKDTYRTKRLCRTVLEGTPSARVTELMGFCSCLRVRPIKGGEFVVTSSGRSVVDSRRSLGRVGEGVIGLKRRFGGPMITAYSIRFVSPRSRVCEEVVVTKGKFSSTSRRTPLCLHAARRVLRRFTCLKDRGTRRIIVAGAGGVTSVVRGVSPVRPSGFPPIVRGSSRSLGGVYFAGTRRVCKGPLPRVMRDELSERLGSVVSGKCTMVCVVTRGLM